MYAQKGWNIYNFSANHVLSQHPKLPESVQVWFWFKQVNFQQIKQGSDYLAESF